MPETVPGAGGDGQMPEAASTRMEGSKEADEMGCRDTGGGPLNSGYPWVLKEAA